MHKKRYKKVYFCTRYGTWYKNHTFFDSLCMFTTIKFPKLQQNGYFCGTNKIYNFLFTETIFLLGLFLFCFAVLSLANQETLRGELDQIMALRSGIDQNLVIQAILSNSMILAILRSIMRTFPSIFIPPISQTLRSQYFR